MLVLIAVLLALLPAVAILYPFLRRLGRSELLEDESSPQAELARRWDAALAGLKNAELERAIGNLSEEDYHWLREQYMTDAALVMKRMELEEEQEQELLSTIDREVQAARRRVLGEDSGGPHTTCPNCSAALQEVSGECPSCGQPIPQVGREEVVGE